MRRVRLSEMVNAQRLRHTHGFHALNGRPGEQGFPIRVVQNTPSTRRLGLRRLSDGRTNMRLAADTRIWPQAMIC